MQTEDFIANLVTIRNAMAQAQDHLHATRFELDQIRGELDDALATVERTVEYLNRIGVELVVMEDDKK